MCLPQHPTLRIAMSRASRQTCPPPSIKRTFTAETKTKCFEKQNNENVIIPTHTSSAEKLMSNSVLENIVCNNLCFLKAFCRSVCSYEKKTYLNIDENLFDLVKNIVFSEKIETHIKLGYSNFTTHQLHIICFYLIEFAEKYKSVKSKNI